MARSHMSESLLKIFSGNSNKALAEDICKSIGVPLGQATVTSFPDYEPQKFEESFKTFPKVVLKFTE